MTNQNAIDQAVNHYRELLEKQARRAEQMNCEKPPEKKEKTVID